MLLLLIKKQPLGEGLIVCMSLFYVAQCISFSGTRWLQWQSTTYSPI